jgi:hypothetical protein
MAADLQGCRLTDRAHREAQCVASESLQAYGWIAALSYQSPAQAQHRRRGFDHDPAAGRDGIGANLSGDRHMSRSASIAKQRFSGRGNQVPHVRHLKNARAKAATPWRQRYAG